MNVHDFPALSAGKAIPCAAFDLERDEAWVSVGVDHDTAEFAVESIRRWWQHMGQDVYGHATELLILADAGGSNGPTQRLWKKCLQQLADETGLKIRVSHYPPGTSKWNPVEHSIFSFVSINWRGRPLRTYSIVISLLNHTTTRQGLKIKAKLDRGKYPLHIKVSEEEMSALKLLPRQGPRTVELLPLPTNPAVDLNHVILCHRLGASRSGDAGSSLNHRSHPDRDLLPSKS